MLIGFHQQKPRYNSSGLIFWNSLFGAIQTPSNVPREPTKISRNCEIVYTRKVIHHPKHVPSSGATLHNFHCFFLIKLIAIIILQYYKLKPLQSLFSKCENNRFIAHKFLPNKHNQSCSSHPIKMRRL